MFFNLIVFLFGVFCPMPWLDDYRDGDSSLLDLSGDR